MLLRIKLSDVGASQTPGPGYRSGYREDFPGSRARALAPTKLSVVKASQVLGSG
jgi:hypothetical protein